MQMPLELSFQNMEPSQFLTKAVSDRVSKLERLHDRITACSVAIEAPHRHHHKGNLYKVRIDLRLPGKKLAVNNKPGDVNAHEDVHVAIRDAFDVMERRLKRWKDEAGGH